MNITELTKKVRESAISRTTKQEIDLLEKSNIIDKNGYYSNQFFSKRTVANDISDGHPIRG